MEEILGNIKLDSTEKIIFLIGAVLIIVIILLITYKLDSMPVHAKVNRAKKNRDDDIDENNEIEEIDDDDIEDTVPQEEFEGYSVDDSMLESSLPNTNEEDDFAFDDFTSNSVDEETEDNTEEDNSSIDNGFDDLVQPVEFENNTIEPTIEPIAEETNTNEEDTFSNQIENIQNDNDDIDIYNYSEDDSSDFQQEPEVTSPENTEYSFNDLDSIFTEDDPSEEDLLKELRNQDNNQ